MNIINSINCLLSLLFKIVVTLLFVNFSRQTYVSKGFSAFVLPTSWSSCLDTLAPRTMPHLLYTNFEFQLFSLSGSFHVLQGSQKDVPDSLEECSDYFFFINPLVGLN